MSVREIIEAVQALNESEKGEFLARLREVDFQDAWDRQMAENAKAGKLDWLVKEADDAIRSGALRDWPDESPR